MKLGIVIYSNDVETVWNAFRFGIFALKKKDEVKIFLLGKGVESENLNEGEFKVSEQMTLFNKKGGEILASGTCLQLRKSKGSDICTVSTLQNLYDIIAESDKILSC